MLTAVRPRRREQEETPRACRPAVELGLASSTQDQVWTPTRTQLVRGFVDGRECDGNEESGDGGAGPARGIEGREGAGGEAFGSGAESVCGDETLGTGARSRSCLITDVGLGDAAAETVQAGRPVGREIADFERAARAQGYKLRKPHRIGFPQANGDTRTIKAAWCHHCVGTGPMPSCSRRIWNPSVGSSITKHLSSVKSTMRFHSRTVKRFG